MMKLHFDGGRTPEPTVIGSYTVTRILLLETPPILGMVKGLDQHEKNFLRMSVVAIALLLLAILTIIYIGENICLNFHHIFINR